MPIFIGRESSRKVPTFAGCVCKESGRADKGNEWLARRSLGLPFDKRLQQSVRSCGFSRTRSGSAYVKPSGAYVKVLLSASLSRQEAVLVPPRLLAPH